MIPPRSTDDPPWLVYAREELGVQEGRDDARILSYRAATKERPWARTSGAGSAWCSDFLCHCLERCGVRSTRSAGAASWRKWGKESPLVPGAVVYFGTDDPDSGGTGHVGFVHAAPVDGWVEVVSGNCRNAVRLKRYRVDAVGACRWPDFS